MNLLSIFTLKVLRKLYSKTFRSYQLPALLREENPDKASDMIYNLLNSNQPCMISRFGANELNAIVNYLGVNAKHYSIWKFIIGEQPEWWWDKGIIYCMQNNAGFFPAIPENMRRFGEMMIEDAKEVDLLGSWLKEEYLLKQYMPNTRKIRLIDLEPFWSKKPWSRILRGKKVLVIHPFAPLIEKQYKEKRIYLFENQDILPDFNLITIQAVQSLGGKNQKFNSWFDALKYMKKQMDEIDYDICLIGCGAYGFPLAAHAKRQGKQAVHIGGSLQLLFGIKGKRWENPNYAKNFNYNKLLNNPYWVRPTQDLKASNSDKVENGCYW